MALWIFSGVAVMAGKQLGTKNIGDICKTEWSGMGV